MDNKLPSSKNTHTENAVAIFDKMATVYQQKYMDVSNYGHSLQFFCEHIIGCNPEILELACGPGNVTKYLLDKRPDLRILATDLSPAMLLLAAQNNPAVQLEKMDCRAMNQLARSFDGIVAGFCLPYLSQEESVQLIEDAASILKPSGLLYLSTMEDAYSKSGFQTGSGGDKIFMYFHEAAYLETALLANGFDILLTERVRTSPQNEVVTDLILIAQITHRRDAPLRV